MVKVRQACYDAERCVSILVLFAALFCAAPADAFNHFRNASFEHAATDVIPGGYNRYNTLSDDVQARQLDTTVEVIEEDLLDMDDDEDLAGDGALAREGEGMGWRLVREAGKVFHGKNVLRTDANT